jgi:MFS family permease
MQRLPGVPAVTVRDCRLLAAYFSAWTLFLAFVAVFAMLASGSNPFHTEAQTLRLLSTPVMLLSLLAGNLLKKLPAPRLLVAALGLALAGCLSFATTGSVASIVGIILLCAGVALAVPSFVTWITEMTQNAMRGLALSLYSCSLFLGATVAPVLVAFFTQRSPAAPAGLAAALLALAATCVWLASGLKAPSCTRSLSGQKI